MKKNKIGYYGTAIWKLDTPFENWLGYRADSSEFFKFFYVLYYKIFDSVYYNKGLPMIDRVIEDFKENSNNKKIFLSNKWLRRDIVYSLHRFGAEFHEYFVFEFYNKNTLGREEFITDKKRYEYYHMLNADENFLLFEDKKNTYNLFGKYYKRDILPIDTLADRDKFLKFTSKHDEFMLKPVGEADGRGILKVSLKTGKEAKEFFDLQINKGRFLAEELIVQDERMAHFNGGTVNTVRVHAIICKGKVKIFYPYFRIGSGEAVVDNLGFGGIVANIDADTGIIYTHGITKKGCRYIIHPNTGAQIVGFQIPSWGQLIELTNEISPLVEGTRWISWDFALTPNGWIVVEGNALGTALAIQGQDRVGRKEELLELIAEGR
jgi:hypothetical protein